MTEHMSMDDRENGLWYQDSQTPLLSPLEDLTEEDVANSPTLKRIPAVPRQTSLPSPLEDLTGLEKEDVADSPTLILKRISTSLKHTPLPPSIEDLTVEDSSEKPFSDESFSDTDSLYLHSNRPLAFPHWFQRKHTLRAAVIALLLLASSAVGIGLISGGNSAWARITGQMAFFESSKFLPGLCIVLAIAFTVSFNIISRLSLSTTRYESAYTILWQLFCALLTPLFLPFDRFSISINSQVLLPFALSVALWALVDAFQFSAFKYEEASVLSAIFPLNFLFTFVVSIVFFHSAIKPTIIIGFLIIMSASLLIGLYHTRSRPSKGIVFAFLCSFFQGVALGFNSEVVKSFSIASYMFVAFLFPALVNLLIFLRPKGAELRYELKVQWKKIVLNAVVMDASFFFLLKAFQLGNVPQVVALSASSTLLTALVGIVVLKEEKHRTLKIIAAVLATLGVILVQR